MSMTIFACTDGEFAVIFPENTDIAFIDEVVAHENKKKLRERSSQMCE